MGKFILIITRIREFRYNRRQGTRGRRDNLNSDGVDGKRKVKRSLFLFR